MKKAVVLVLGFILLLSLAYPVLAAKRDTLKPYLTTSTPFDEQVNVLKDSKIIVQFNEVLLKGNGSRKIKIVDSNNKEVDQEIFYSGSILWLTPKRSLNYGEEYRIIIPSTAFKDKSGNFLAQDYQIDFMTESEDVAMGIAKDSDVTEASNYTIGIDVVMDKPLNEDEKSYLLAALKAIGIRTKDINVKERDEENIESEPDATLEEVNETVEEENQPEEDTISHDLYLVDYGNNKTMVIKIIRELTGLGLKEANDLVNATADRPQLLLEGIGSADTGACSKRLEVQGATVLILNHGETLE